MAHVMFSRGCPFPCRFRAAAQTRIQYRSGASARRGLESMIGAYDIDGFAIVDDNFIVNKHKVRDICLSIRDLNLRWSAHSRVDTIDQPRLDDMAASGCIEVKFGMESGDEGLLKSMRKNTKQDQIRAAVRMAKAAGINVKLFLIHGYPGENLDTTSETMRLLDALAGEHRTIVDVHVLLVRDGQILLSQRLGGYGAGLWHMPSVHLASQLSEWVLSVRRFSSARGVAAPPIHAAVVRAAGETSLRRFYPYVSVSRLRFDIRPPDEPVPQNPPSSSLGVRIPMGIPCSGGMTRT